MEGQFIHRKFNEDSSPYYTFENYEAFDVTFVQLVNRILPICSYHDILLLFENLHGGLNKPLLLQAFCLGLRCVRDEYYKVVAKAEEAFGKGNLNLQTLWFCLQDISRVLQSVTLLISEVSDIQRYKGNLLSTLQKSIATSIDQKMNKLYGFLLQKTVKPYLFILGKWLYFGILEDMHGEFFVVLHQDHSEEVFDTTDLIPAKIRVLLVIEIQLPPGESALIFGRFCRGDLPLWKVHQCDQRIRLLH